ncbi:gene transfer agent family protein [Pseudorhizobium endolithicum]|uniref:Gene transfer agent family protein n=1 Tax=Pseudorhizobium endolithicum TaxID=1191678 RepID=A0ABM8PFC7_9HYPH|nr:gene transfer agent family protein [Pseudorhizobium endolithicum]CAD7026593.1 gene transfer agent family protein [Pseudorhizobium endolithicum]
MITHTAFFGDGEKTFAFTHELLLELERKTGHGIFALFTRVQTRQASFADMAETIRIGLIGGGATPAEAAALINTYAVARPLGESLAVALGILSTLFFGPDEPEADPQSDLRQAAASGDLSAAVNEALNRVAA